MNDEKEVIAFDRAIEMLKVRDGFVHTFRSSPGMLLGADWKESSVLEAIRKFGAEKSGPAASAMHHCIAVIDDRGPLFLETKADLAAIEAREAKKENR